MLKLRYTERETIQRLERQGKAAGQADIYDLQRSKQSASQKRSCVEEKMIRRPCLDMMGSNCAKIVLRDRTGQQCGIAYSATPTSVKPAMTTTLVASVLAVTKRTGLDTGTAKVLLSI